jgi:hypothetical protein
MNSGLAIEKCGAGLQRPAKAFSVQADASWMLENAEQTES